MKAEMIGLKDRAFVLLELIAFLLLLACVWVGVTIVHAHVVGLPGFILGGLAGVCAFLVCGAFIALLVDYGFRGVPRIPKCKSGRCLANDYEIRNVGDKYLRVCACGEQYRRRGRRFVVVEKQGIEIPYLIWQPFRGWRPDTGR